MARSSQRHRGGAEHASRDRGEPEPDRSCQLTLRDSLRQIRDGQADEVIDGNRVPGVREIDVAQLSSQLVGHHVVLQLDAQQHFVQVLHEQQVVKALPLKGLVGQLLSFEQFLAHMLRQARAQARLRSLQERKYRTAAFTSP